MGDIIYFKKYDEPIPYEHKYGDKVFKGERTGEFICNDERVEKFWFYGTTSMKLDDTMDMYASFLFKNGERHEVKIDCSTNNDIEQAEKFLSELPTTNVNE